MIAKKIKMLVLAGIMGMSILTPVYADAPSSEEIERMDEELQGTQSNLENVESRISDLESKKGEAEAYLTELNGQLSDLTQQLTDLQEQYAENQKKLDTTSQELEDARNEEEKQREDMGIRIQYMYEQSAGAGTLTAVLSADSFTDMLNQASNFSELESYDRKALKEYTDTCTEIEKKQAELEDEMDRLKNLADETGDKKEEITTLYEKTKTDVDSYVASLQGEKESQADLLESIAEQQQQIEAMKASAAEEVAREDEAAEKEKEEEQSRAAEQQQTAAAAQTDAESSAADTETASSAQAQTQTSTASSSYSGAVLTRSAGRIQGPSGGETYYNLNMSGVVNIMRNMGNTDEYWVREDGVKMLGDYVMVAANLSVHPRGSIVQSSLGEAIVVDTGGFASQYPNNLDIATNW